MRTLNRQVLSRRAFLSTLEPELAPLGQGPARLWSADSPSDHNRDRRPRARIERSNQRSGASPGGAAGASHFVRHSRVGGLALGRASRRVTLAGRALRLTATEYRLLAPLSLDPDVSPPLDGRPQRGCCKF